VVTARRRGYENGRDIIQENKDYIPGRGNISTVPHGTQDWYDCQSDGYKRIFKSSGILLEDGKINIPLFEQHGWPILAEGNQNRGDTQSEEVEA
jgi:hypothetical protein